MTRQLRRLLARRAAKRVRKQLCINPSYTCSVRTFGLFEENSFSKSTSHGRVMKFQDRVTRAVEVPGARIHVTKDRRRLNIYATVRS